MDRWLGMIFGFKDVKFRNDDDFFDRLTRRHTCCLLLIMALVITTHQYVGDPIHCWAPAHFTDAHKAYTNTICWVKNTYYVPWEDEIPKPYETHKRQMLSYYQWVPLILLCQAMLCYLPSIIWRAFSRRSGINIAAIMDSAIAGQRTSYADIREKTVRYMVNQVDRYLMARLERGRGCWSRIKSTAARYCCLVYGKFSGNYLTVGYMIVKLLYVVNSVGQLFMLDAFLGTDYHVYGFEVIRRFVTRDDWTRSERFPRVTLCDFLIRHQGHQQHRYIVQCVLPINLFNEKIFIAIWFWFAILCILSIVSFIKWSLNLSFWPAQVSYIKRSLRCAGIVRDKREKELVEKFSTRYLRRDGIFLLRLISNNVGHIVSYEVLAGLWDNFGPDHRLMNEKEDKELQPGGTATVAVRLNALADKLDNV